MKNLFECNKKFTEPNKISLNTKVFWNRKIFTEHETSSDRKLFLWILKFFSEYKNLNFAPNDQPYKAANTTFPVG